MNEIRLLICGDRNWSDRDLILQVVTEIKDLVECVIEGEASGADVLARSVAEELGIPVLKFPAEWATYGKAAGPVRNRAMLREGKPNLVIAFHDDLEHSKGTKDMCRQATRGGIEVRVVNHRKDNS